MTSARRIDFSDNARLYDRRHGAVLGVDEAVKLATAAALDTTSTVLDIGAGTGRVAVPIARRVANVIALEPAAGMLERLRAKTGGMNVSCVVGEGDQLPFPAGCFHSVFVARLLYLTPAWRRIVAEAHRACMAGGYVLHEWGNGAQDESWVQLREMARSMFEDAGAREPFHPGARSEPEVDAYLVGLGFVKEPDVLIGAGAPVTLRDFLRQLVTGELSYIWDIPDSTRRDCLPRLSRWAEQTFDLDQTAPVPRELRWSVYRKR